MMRTVGAVRDRGNLSTPVRGQSGWWRRLAPEPPRTFRSERAWSIALRTAHIVAFSVVLGGYFWGVEPARVRPAFAAAIVAGCALAGLELYKSLHWLFLIKGLAVVVKLALLAWVPFLGTEALPLLMAVVVLASVGAHMPSRYRHYSVLLRRVVRSPPKEPLDRAPSGTGMGDGGQAAGAVRARSDPAPSPMPTPGAVAAGAPAPV